MAGLIPDNIGDMLGANDLSDVASKITSRFNLDLTPSSAQAVIYVSKSTLATDTRTGLSAYDPFRPFASLAAANTAASSGDVIIMTPGAYAQGDATVTLKDGVNLRGFGIGKTILTATRVLADGPILQPGELSRISDLTIQGIAAPGQYQAPFGTTSGSSWVTAYIERIEIIGDSDGIYFVDGTRNLYARDCIIRTKFDCINFAGGNAHYIRLTNCELYAIGPTLVSPAQTIARCVALGAASTLEMFGGILKARDGGATYTLCFTSGGSAVGYFECVEFDATSSSGPFRVALMQAGTAVIRGGRVKQTDGSGILYSSFSAGHVELYNLYLSTAGDAVNSPIKLLNAGSTLKVRNCTLISNGSLSSIDNGGAATYTVDAWGCFANNAVDVGITANGLTVDATVT